MLTKGLPFRSQEGKGANFCLRRAAALSRGWPACCWQPRRLSSFSIPAYLFTGEPKAERRRCTEYILLTDCTYCSFIFLGRYPGLDHVELRVESTSGDVMRMELPTRIDARNMVLLAEMIDLVGRQGKVLVA